MVKPDKKKVLLVEDDQFIRDLYVELLEGAGYEVDVAVDGEEGYAKMQRGGYDLVLLDIIMPKMDAIQVLTELKKTPPKEKNQHIIFMTNLGQENVVKNCKGLGVEDYLIKSDLTPDQFLAKVRKILQA